MFMTEYTEMNCLNRADVNLTSRVTACHIPILRKMGVSSQKFIDLQNGFRPNLENFQMMSPMTCAYKVIMS